MPEIGKCYTNGKGDCIGPMRPYGFMLMDHLGFAYFRDSGRFFPAAAPFDRPERDLVDECVCPEKRKK